MLVFLAQAFYETVLGYILSAAVPFRNVGVSGKPTFKG